MIKINFWSAIAACLNFFAAGAGVYALSIGNTNTSVFTVGMFFVAGVAWLINGGVRVKLEEKDYD